MILVIASMGIERIAPGIPQKTSEMMTRTGLRVNRLAQSLALDSSRKQESYGTNGRSREFRYRERAGHLRQLR